MTLSVNTSSSQISEDAIVQAILAFNAYGKIGTPKKISQFQLQYFSGLDGDIKSKIGTIASRVHKIEVGNETVSELILSNQLKNAENLIFSYIENMGNIKKDETKIKFIDAIHEFVHILSMSEIGSIKETTSERVQHTVGGKSSIPEKTITEPEKLETA